MKKFVSCLLLILSLTGLVNFAQADTTQAYTIQPGDVLAITVWKEEDLQRQAVVLPDGKITFPLAGEIQAGGRDAETLRADISRRLSKYIPDPVVTVSVQELNGNRIYVIGKVNRPGEFAATRYVARHVLRSDCYNNNSWHEPDLPSELAICFGRLP